MKLILSSALVMFAAFACGGGGGGSGGSGVPGNTQIADLSPDQEMDMCDFIVDVFGPEREVDCGDGVTITRGGEDFDECIADFADFETCDLTAGEFEACANAVAALSDQQLCTQDTVPPACAPLFACIE
jgi:hypothetical protein